MDARVCGIRRRWEHGMGHHAYQRRWITITARCAHGGGERAATSTVSGFETSDDVDG